jgi:hypothetical protein
MISSYSKHPATSLQVSFTTIHWGYKDEPQYMKLLCNTTIYGGKYLTGIDGEFFCCIMPKEGFFSKKRILN